MVPALSRRNELACIPHDRCFALALAATRIDPLRFRANVYFSVTPTWSELDWAGAEIGVGTARLRVVSPITRCAATMVSPATAERDLNIPATLQRKFGHNCMGVYGEVLEAGEIAKGSAIRLNAAPPPQGDRTANVS